MSLSRALSALLAATALAACSAGAGAPAPTATPTPGARAARPVSDGQLARQAVIGRSDFPHGWRLTTATGGLIKCRPATAARHASTGYARSPTFALGENTEAEGLAFVYAEQAGAERHFKPLSGSATTSCIVRAVRRLLTTKGRFNVGTISTKALRVEAVGDERAGTRITIPVSRGGAGANVLIDLVVVRAGRALSVGFFVDALNPFDPGFRAKLTDAQVGRLRAGA